MTFLKRYTRKQLNVILGILLIIAAIVFGKTGPYTFMKNLVASMGGSITLAVAVAMGVILLCLTSGVFLLRRS
ncbi:hypothetical protein [Fodinibius halophilus]|uniref:Uncharacterized protein n=1 Tax=Fodinibius halophilus TaxID=1736908 RepID=A0A6M1T7W8_9BACT|nr:hypothetical protein [Fodinibius halophilus]NGP87224.1 hypothetical protein [Fodinibius halophilus]